MGYKDFTEMSVWQKANRLLLQVYTITKDFPNEEKFGIVSDMRRAANSVTNNIAEGFGRYEKRDKTRFYKISRGSCYELINQTISSFGLSFIKIREKEKIISGYREVIKELDPMIKTIESIV